MKQLPNITTDFAEWYQEVIYQAELVDQSPVRGSMVVRPYGCAIWEQMVKVIDQRLKDTGHENALFPLFIPESFLKREAEHVEGFAPELAVVTHAGGKELEERLVVRPTSETIIHHMFARWINSWRDLPLKINQWANVVRWEMRPRPFLRTTEFYWQEGHTAHASHEEAHQEATLILDEYVAFAQNYLAIPVITGQKTPKEKFPGAETTLTFEAIMQDGKALQMGTSHLLSQSFAHAFEMKFQDKEGVIAYPYLTSWGVTTRLVGAMVMTHGDQKGLIIPPRIAPVQVVVIPIFRSPEEMILVGDAIESIKKLLEIKGIRVHVDTTDSKTPGAKFYKWELKGVPLRIEVGPRDLANQSVTVVQRVDGTKQSVLLSSLPDRVISLMNEIHEKMLAKAAICVDSWRKNGIKLADFGPVLEQKNGLYQTSWCGAAECEIKVKEYKATVRCIVPDQAADQECFVCTNKGTKDILVAKAY